MVDIRVDFKGLKETTRFMTDLPKNMDRELSKANQEFMENVKNDAIKLAPRDTGELKQSIELEPVRKGKNIKKWKLVVGAEHGIYQEEGFTPHFAFIRNSSKLAPGRYWVKKNTPFVKPSLERNFNRYLNMLTVSTKRALAK